MLVNFLMGGTFMLRWREERASLTWENIRFSNVSSGKFMGRRKLELVSLLDKTSQVSVTNPVHRDNTGVMDAAECVNDHSTCVSHWVQYYQTLCPPGQEPFYCYPASAKLLKVSNIQSNIFLLLY